MNFKAKNGKPSKLGWKKIAVIAIVLAVAGYEWYTQNYSAEKPAVVAAGQSNQEGKQSHSKANSNASSTASDKATAQSRNSNRAGNNTAPDNSTKSSVNDKPNTQADGSYLQPAGGKNLKSPAGLIYTNSRSEHRSDHVLRHARDIPDRPGTHGVFNANGDDVFRLVDEAYQLVKANSTQVKTKAANDGKTEYVIDLKRKIGYKGGQSGKRANHPPLYKVKLILADNRVITAYPY